VRERAVAVGGLFVLWVLGTIGFIYGKVHDDIENIKIILLSLGGFGVVSATLLNIWNSWDASSNVLSQIKFAQIDNSFKYLERWESEPLKSARNLTRKIKKEKLRTTDEELLKHITEDEELERSVITMFNFWESMYYAIEKKRVDEDILREAFSDTYCDIRDRFGVWLKDIEEKQINIKGLKALNNLYKKWKFS